MKYKLKDYIKLYLSFFKLGLFTFGGGLSMISLMTNEFVEKKKILTSKEMLDLVAISETTPGPIAINSATFIGNKLGGILGGIVASLGAISPSIIIICLIAAFYDHFINIEIIQKALNGILAGVIVLIFFSLFKLSKGLKNSGILIVNIFIILISFLLRLLLNINPVLIIIGSGLVGILLYSLLLRKKVNYD